MLNEVASDLQQSLIKILKTIIPALSILVSSIQVNVQSGVIFVIVVMKNRDFLAELSDSEVFVSGNPEWRFALCWGVVKRSFIPRSQLARLTVKYNASF